MRILQALTISALMTANAWAEGDVAVNKALECSKIEDSLQRLSCFDVTFPRNATADKPEFSPHQDGAKWVIDEDKSPIDDSVRINSGLLPKSVSYSGIGSGNVLLMFQCRENTTRVMLITNMFMSDETIPVTVRFGDEKASTSNWSRSTNYESVGLWDGGSAIPFIRKAVSHEKLAVRIQSQNQINAEFDLGNVVDAAQKISAACGWKIED